MTEFKDAKLAKQSITIVDVNAKSSHVESKATISLRCVVRESSPADLSDSAKHCLHSVLPDEGTYVNLGKCCTCLEYPQVC